MFYSGDEYADEEATSGPIPDEDDEVAFWTSPWPGDVPVEYVDERRS